MADTMRMIMMLGACLLCFILGYYAALTTTVFKTQDSGPDIMLQLAKLDKYMNEAHKKLDKVSTADPDILRLKEYATDTKAKIDLVDTKFDLLYSEMTQLEKHIGNFTARPLPTLAPSTCNRDLGSVAILTLFNKDANTARTRDQIEVFRIGLLSHLMYAHRHAYPYFWYHDGKDLDLTRHPVWSKMPLLKKYLKQYKWILWIDSDSIIMNPHHTIEEFIDNQYDIIITKDYGGLNFGVFLMQSTEWTFKFLDMLSGEDSYRNFKGQSHKEQAAFVDWTRRNPDETNKHIKFLPQRTINQYAKEFSEGDGTDFLVHLPGLVPEDRVKLQKDFLNKSLSTYQLPDFVIRVEDRHPHTPY